EALRGAPPPTPESLSPGGGGVFALGQRGERTIRTARTKSAAEESFLSFLSLRSFLSFLRLGFPRPRHPDAGVEGLGRGAVRRGEEGGQVQLAYPRTAAYELRQAEEHLAEDLQIGAGLAPYPLQELHAADAADHLQGLMGRERQEAEADVLEDLHVFAPQAEHEDGTEARIGGDAEDHL